MKFFRDRRRSVVDQVHDQTGQASALAGIEGQKLLGDPRTNPAIRPHADRLRDDQQREALTLEHRRALRRGRVSDRRAAHAERTLQAIQDAKEVVSPARAVTSLQLGRRRFLSVALIASLLLSAGSALGLAAISVHTGGVATAGWIAELCLTMATTGAILYRSHIDQANTADDPDSPIWQGWRHPVLVVLVIAPLTASVLINFGGWVVGAPVSPVNALCAVGAGVAAVFAYLVADVSSRAVRVNARAVDTADEEELRREAVGDDLFNLTTTGPRETTEAPDPEPEQVDEGAAAVAAIEEWLGERSRVGHDVADRAQEPSEPPVNGTRHINGATRHFVPDQGNDGTCHTVAPRNGGGVVDVADDGGESSEQVVDAVHANRLKGAHTRLRVAEHLAVNPTHNARQVGEALSISESTARRYMKELVEEGEE